MSFRRWGIHLPSRDYSIEIEDWVPALAATIGKVVMVTAMVSAFAAQFGLSPEFIAETCVTNYLSLEPVRHPVFCHPKPECKLSGNPWPNDTADSYDCSCRRAPSRARFDGMCFWVNSRLNQRWL